ncbi:MAG: hypothetical protein HGA96_12965 [Desulfobulbaceae bacterium]|nr:hypothetical protein [Desulfobulbaceae bacterium]
MTTELPGVPPSDNMQIRCRKLGQLIHYGYCCRENQGLPCARTLDCWYPYFDVAAYLRGVLTPEEWAAVFATPAKPKVLSLVELLEQAQRNVGKQ